jgi:hypothetical protein
VDSTKSEEKCCTCTIEKHKRTARIGTISHLPPREEYPILGFLLWFIVELQHQHKHQKRAIFDFISHPKKFLIVTSHRADLRVLLQFIISSISSRCFSRSSPFLLPPRTTEDRNDTRSEKISLA